jgi:hypothetical protein
MEVRGIKSIFRFFRYRMFLEEMASSWQYIRCDAKRKMNEPHRTEQSPICWSFSVQTFHFNKFCLRIPYLKMQWNLELSFPDVSFYRIHRSISVITEQLLFKILVFHGGNYEESHLLRYKTTVRTSQETHYISATETSRLMLCKIWGFHGGDYKEWRLLSCYAVWLL